MRIIQDIRGNILYFFKWVTDFVLKKSDPALLFFLMAILNYRYSLKILAILLIFIYRPNFKLAKSGTVFFFLSMIFLGTINLFISKDFSYNHIATVLAGCVLWLSCLLVFHQVKLSIQNNTINKVVNTIKIIVILNFCVSIFDFIQVISATQTINPYTQIALPPYGAMSGDRIGGIFGQGTHLVNICISLMFFIFFLSRRNFCFSILSLLPFMMASSNLATIILFGILCFTFIIKNDKIYRYYVLFSMTIIIVFYVKINPFNFYEITRQFHLSSKNILFENEYKKALSETDEIDQKRIMYDSLYTFWMEVDSAKNMNSNYHIKTGKEAQQYVKSKKNTADQTKTPININQAKEFKAIAKNQQREKIYRVWFVEDSLRKVRDHNLKYDYGKLKKFNLDSCPGVIISYTQTKDFLLKNKVNLLFGAGIGSFSSRLAFVNSKTFSDSRLLGALPRYEDSLFTTNHKALWKYLDYAGEDTHSIKHMPFSGYNQIFGEYGLLGFIAFVILYLGTFLYRWKRLTYGKFLLILIIPLFAFDYWFERISVMVVFEFFMLLDLAQNQKTDNSDLQRNTIN